MEFDPATGDSAFDHTYRRQRGLTGPMGWTPTATNIYVVGETRSFGNGSDQIMVLEYSIGPFRTNISVSTVTVQANPVQGWHGKRWRNVSGGGTNVQISAGWPPTAGVYELERRRHETIRIPSRCPCDEHHLQRRTFPISIPPYNDQCGQHESPSPVNTAPAVR